LVEELRIAGGNDPAVRRDDTRWQVPLQLKPFEHGDIVLDSNVDRRPMMVVKHFVNAKGLEQVLPYGRVEGPSWQIPAGSNMTWLAGKRIWTWGYMMQESDIEALDAVSADRTAEILARWAEWFRQGLIVRFNGRTLRQADVPFPEQARQTVGQVDVIKAAPAGLKKNWTPPHVDPDSPIPF
ncbi:hypothetical protein LCGC14_2567740, partial [marine sediment metagenome]